MRLICQALQLDACLTRRRVLDQVKQPRCLLADEARLRLLQSIGRHSRKKPSAELAKDLGIRDQQEWWSGQAMEAGLEALRKRGIELEPVPA